METAPGIPRPSREPINRYPVKVTPIIKTAPPQIKLLQGGSHPVLRTLHLSLRDNPSEKEGMDLEGFEPSLGPCRGPLLPLHHGPTNQSLLQFAQSFGPPSRIY